MKIKVKTPGIPLLPTQSNRKEVGDNDETEAQAVYFAGSPPKSSNHCNFREADHPLETQS